jgi:predicted signal transduction protein with EAL and GGDEF domain
VARLGGDEFAIVHPASPLAKDDTALAHELVQRISKPYDIGGNRLTVTASVGVSSSGEACADSDRMLRNSDVALYRAKESGRNAFRFYDPSMDHHLEEKRAKELAVRNALARGEFEVHYQPFVSVINERICGLEALLRWRHPERGLLPPADFIPVAKEAGFIGTLGEWVLRKACEDAAGWLVYIGLAVNISPSQCNAALTQIVMSALAMSRLSPGQLEMEITESALLQDSSTTVSVLHQLRGLGVKISMDDFGTGYSSLSYLRSFPFDKIKIDKSFVKDVLTDSDSLAIVRAWRASARASEFPPRQRASRRSNSSSRCVRRAAPTSRAFISGAPCRSTKCFRCCTGGARRSGSPAMLESFPPLSFARRDRVARQPHSG